MSWVATAVVGGAVIGAGASIYSGSQASSAAKSAAKTSSKAQTDSALIQKEMYDQTRQDQEAWRVAGEKALQAIQERPDFEFNADTFNQFKDPSYDFRMQEGINALDRSAAARGRVLSGAQDRAVTRYGSNLASQEYGNAFSRALTTDQYNLNKQQSLAGVGQNANNILAQAGQQTAGNLSNIAMQGAQTQGNIAMSNAQAQGNMASGIAQSVNQGMGNYLLYKSL